MKPIRCPYCGTQVEDGEPWDMDLNDEDHIYHKGCLSAKYEDDRYL